MLDGALCLAFTWQIYLCKLSRPGLPYFKLNCHPLSMPCRGGRGFEMPNCVCMASSYHVKVICRYNGKALMIWGYGAGARSSSHWCSSSKVEWTSTPGDCEERWTTGTWHHQRVSQGLRPDSSSPSISMLDEPCDAFFLISGSTSIYLLARLE